MIPLWDQTGTPSGLDGFLHFTSSTTVGSACLMRARNCDKVVPRQSSHFPMIASICAEAATSSMSRFFTLNTHQLAV
jgi:hypothetical protein